MALELDDKEKEILKDILESYLSDLREEIVKTEDHKWKAPPRLCMKRKKW